MHTGSSENQCSRTVQLVAVNFILSLYKKRGVERIYFSGNYYNLAEELTASGMSIFNMVTESKLVSLTFDLLKIVGIPHKEGNDLFLIFQHKLYKSRHLLSNKLEGTIFENILAAENCH